MAGPVSPWYERPMAIAKRGATYEDLEQVPDSKVAELIEGDLIVSPRPASPHARAATVLSSRLNNAFDGPPGSGRPGGWWILFEPEIHFGSDVLVPDVAAWRHERMAKIPNVAAFTLAPDWICEVASSSTGIVDRTRKMPIYAREGIQHLWIVDPVTRTLEIYRLEEGRWIVAGTHGGDDRVQGEPFDAITLELDRLWLEPEPYST
jgi:Uma2 family endonuclease